VMWKLGIAISLLQFTITIIAVVRWQRCVKELRKTRVELKLADGMFLKAMEHIHLQKLDLAFWEQHVVERARTKDLEYTHRKRIEDAWTITPKSKRAKA
jgi:hypothetical protein